jgi:glycine oxidase
VAWRACAASVTVVDPAPGTGASWVAGGMLAPTAEAYRGEEALTALALASVDRWPRFVADLEQASGLEVGYSERGTLVVARDADDAAQLHDLLACQLEQGLTVEHVGSREAAARTGARPGGPGALWLPADHQVDNRARGRPAGRARPRVEIVDDLATEVGASTVTTAAARRGGRSSSPREPGCRRGRRGRCSTCRCVP